MTVKFFCYVDESGQDTQGQLFVVGVVLTSDQRDELKRHCEALEQQSGKRRLKWYEAEHTARMAYMRSLLHTLPSSVQLYFATYQHSLDYFGLTVDALARALQVTITDSAENENYKVTVLIDGLPRGREQVVGSLLRRRGIRIDKVRGVKKEENDTLIRLADALCGFIRLVLAGKAEAKTLFDEAIRQGSLRKVAE